MNYDFGEIKRNLLDEESGVLEKFAQSPLIFSEKGVKIAKYYSKRDDIATACVADCAEAREVEIVKILVKELKNMLKNLRIKNCVLCCGIGNPYMVSDSLGYQTIRKMMGKGGKKLKLLVPFLDGLTGIKSRDIIQILTKELDADAVIVIDSLATKKVDRVGKSYQFSRNGLTPGSALGGKGAIDDDFLGVETIAIGVPTVVRVSESGRDTLFAPKEIDSVIEVVSKNLSDIILQSTL